MSKEELSQILMGQKIAVLSTLDSDNNLHGSTVFFINDDNLNFFIVTKSNTHKYKNIKSNNRVALTVIFSDDQKTVQSEGDVEEIARGTELYHKVILDMSERNAMQGGISWPPPTAKIPDDEIIILKVTPKSLRYYDYSMPEGEILHQIIP